LEVTIKYTTFCSLVLSSPSTRHNVFSFVLLSDLTFCPLMVKPGSQDKIITLVPDLWDLAKTCNSYMDTGHALSSSWHRVL